MQGRYPGSPLAKALVYKTYPTGGDPGTDVFVDLAKFPEIFAADVDPDLTKVLAVGQRQLAAVAFIETASAAAWKTRPAWGSVASNPVVSPGHAVAPERGRRPHSHRHRRQLRKGEPG